MAREVDPLIGFQFSLDVNGITGYFTEVSGIGSENAVTTHKVVRDGKEITLQIPGRAEWGEITLKRGLTKDVQFWDWRQQVVEGKVAEARVDCTITMYDREYTPATSWTVFNAWPSKLTGPNIAADSNDFTIEEMTIVHEGLYRDEMLAMVPDKEEPS